MKFTRFLLAALCSLAAFSSCEDPVTPPDPVEPDIPAVPVPDFAKGADVSWVSEMEADGKTFKTKEGMPTDIFEVLKGVGVNSIRLRVWVNPTGGWSGKEDCVKLASRAAKAGLAVMIDFHYSDFFADPSRQDFPKDWLADKANLMNTIDRVKAHTTEVLEAIKAAGVAPAWIQIGNETSNGFLWPLGSLWGEGGSWASFTQLYNSGYAAAKKVFPSAIVMPHLNNAYADNVWWFRDFKAQGGKFDAIALSHYPQGNSSMTPEQMNSTAVSRIQTLASTFGVPVIVSEVGVKAYTESESAAVLKSFVDSVKDLSACKGVFYWEPEVYGGWKPAVYSTLGWGGYDGGAFTSDGRPSSIMNAFKN